MQIMKRIFLVAGCLLLVPALAFSVPIGYRLCKDTLNYTCYKVKKSDTWQKLFPDTRTRELVKRINRQNIELSRGMHIAIPKNLTEDYLTYAPLPGYIPPPGKKLILVSINPDTLAWGAYNSDGALVNWGPAVGGKRYCSDINRGCATKTGQFEVYRKGGAGCVSTKYPVGKGGAPMPWCMYFNGGFAMHGSYDVPGINASHGCIRLFVSDAAWLNKEFVSDDKVSVIITKTQYEP